MSIVPINPNDPSNLKVNDPVFPVDNYETLTEAEKLELAGTGILDEQARILNDYTARRYPMSKDQDSQIDCRITECEFNSDGGCCKNVSPAITLNADGTFVCWSKKIADLPK